MALSCFLSFVRRARARRMARFTGMNPPDLKPTKPTNSHTRAGRFANKRFAIIGAVVLVFLLIAIFVPF